MAGYAKQRANWQDFPVTSTPILASNLNALETAIFDLKRNEFLDVKADYGADATGAADCSSAINTALADLPNGGVLFFPVGTYRITSAITLPALTLKGISIVGASPGATKITYSGSGYCFAIDNSGLANAAWYSGLRDLSIDLSGSATPTGAVNLKNAQFCYLRNLDILGPTGGSKILINFDPGAGTITNYFNQVDHCRIRGQTQASDIGIKLAAVDGAGAGSNYVKNCHLATFNQSILIDAGHTNVIEACEFNGSTNTAIRLQQTVASAYANKIMWNQFDGPTVAVDIAAGVDQTALIGNTPSTAPNNDNGTNTIFLQGSNGFRVQDVSWVRQAANEWGTTANVATLTAGRGFMVKEGTNAKMGVATLVAGTVVVSTTAVTATSRIFLTGQNSSGTHGELTVSARTAGTSFTITSSSGTDTRSVAWLIMEPS